jgi:hypothetical protein
VAQDPSHLVGPQSTDTSRPKNNYKYDLVGEITKGQCRNTKYMKWICGLEDGMGDDAKVSTIAPSTPPTPPPL